MHKPSIVMLLVFALFLLTAAEFSRNLSLTIPRMSGKDVLSLQNRLVELAFPDVGVADGWFGPKTEAAVRAAQGLLGLFRTGVVDKELWILLFGNDPSAAAIAATLKSVNLFGTQILANFKNTPRIYRYDYYGKKYETSTYSLSTSSDANAFQGQLIVAMKIPALGYFVYSETSTPSGDWFLVQQDYYGPDGVLVFTVWDLNTFYASEGGASVKKRVFLGTQGQVLRQTVRTYKMNTDIPLETDFMDQDIELVRDIKDLPFRSLLKW